MKKFDLQVPSEEEYKEALENGSIEKIDMYGFKRKALKWNGAYYYEKANRFFVYKEVSE